MADPFDLEKNAPAIPPAQSPTPPQNEPARTEITAGENFGDKIRAAVAPVAAKFGVVLKPGRGRPKKDGSPKISDVVEREPGVATSPAAALDPAAVVAAQFNGPGHVLFRRIVEKAARSEISILKSFVEIKSEAAGLEKDFTARALAAATPAEKSFSDLAESADYVAIKHGWNVDKMPEIALGLDVLHLHAPLFTLFVALNSEIKRRRAAEKLAATPPAPPAPEK